MKKDEISKMQSDEQDETTFAKSTDERDHTSLTTEERPAETHNAISNPDGDGVAENRVSTTLDDE